MPLSTLTREEAIELIKSEIETAYPDADLSRFSDFDLEARILAALYLGNQAQAEYAIRARHALTAPDDALDAIAKARGTERQAAAKSRGFALVRASAAAILIPAGTVLIAPSGKRFVTLANATTIAPAWSGKLTGESTGRSRLVVVPDSSGISAGDPFSVDGAGYGGALAYFVARDVVAGSGVDLYRRLREIPIVGSTITAITGCLVEVEAEEAGSDGNFVDGWTLLSFETPIVNVEPQAIAETISGGGDEESNEDLRARLVVIEAGSSGQGTVGDYVKWTTETPEVRVARAFVFPNLVALGVITVVAEGVSGARKLSGDSLAMVESYLEEVRPLLDALDVRTRDDTSITASVSLSIVPKAGFEPDFASSFTTVLGSTVSRVNLSAPPFEIEVGDRVLVPISVDGRARLVQRTVSAKNDSVPTYYVDLSEPLEVAPAGSVQIVSGGPLAQPLIDAVERYFDDLGPGLVAGPITFERWPGTDVEGDDTVRVADLIALAMGVRGVENVTVISPTSDVEPTALSTIGLGSLSITWG